MAETFEGKLSCFCLHNSVVIGLTRIEIVGNSILLILAGYDTTTNAMTFLMYNLATHPEVQEKLREEIDKAIENYVSFALGVIYTTHATKNA